MKFYNYIFDSYFRSILLWVFVTTGLVIPIGEWENNSLSLNDFIFVPNTVLLLFMYYITYRLNNE